MKKNKMYHLVCGILVISAAASISVSAGTAKRKVKPVTRYNTAETAASTQAATQAQEKKTVVAQNGVYHLSENSKYRPYLWKNADGSAPDYKAYVFEPKVFNGHTVFVDPGHGDNSAPEANQKREKYYPVDDSLLKSMKTSMVGAKAYGVGVEARDSKNVYDKIETEPEFSLKVALKLKDLLINNGYRVVMSRTDFNQNISNGARSAIAGETSDIMVSIHSNTGKNSGTLSFYPGDSDYISGSTYPGYTNIMGLTKSNVELSKKLAENMESNITMTTGLKNKGTHSAVLRIFSYSSIPTCLVEVGFADNATDAKILSTKKDAIATSMANAIDQYFNK
ncbi:N-acetylmuramoyl-L-alanine amidase [Lachnospiraceae bacterium oral taxon 082 str. F0431]|nr:N-acetylmuramoyl-L-alanine amidase [Lachnospiraceae bacterium oral taxon 082 str. F0431]